MIIPAFGGGYLPVRIRATAGSSLRCAGPDCQQ